MVRLGSDAIPKVTPCECRRHSLIKPERAKVKGGPSQNGAQQNQAYKRDPEVRARGRTLYRAR